MQRNSCVQHTCSPKRAAVTHSQLLVPRSRSLRRTFVCSNANRLANPFGRSRQEPAGRAVTEPSVVEKAQHRATCLIDYSPLLLVSALWGSYAPVLRYLYSMDPLLTPQVLTAHRTVISAVALLAASATSICYSTYVHHQQLHQQKQQLMLQQQLEQQQHWQHRITAMLPDWMQHLGRGQQLQEESASSLDGSSSSSNAAAATASAAAVLAAGLELGVWNFLGTSSQAIGLELSTATKAAFLTQMTAVVTPCLAVLCGQAVLPAHWVACLVALLGSCCITLDSLLATQSLQQINDTQTPQQQVVAAVRDAARSSSSSSSEVLFTAPPLIGTTESTGGGSSKTIPPQRQQQQQQEGQQLAVVFTDSIPSGSTTVGGSSSSASDITVAAGVVVTNRISSDVTAAVPGVTCNPAATPPQGVVPAMPCAPLTTAGNSSSSSSDANVTSAVLVGSSSSAIDLGAAGSSSSSRASAAVHQRQLQQQPLSSGQTVVKFTEQQQQQQGEQQQPSILPLASWEQSNTSSSSSWSGEVYTLLACCCYAIATVRLSMLAPGLDPVQLATSKTLTLAAASLCWLLAFQDGSVTTTTAAAAALPTADSVTAAAAAANADVLSVKAAIAAALHSAAEKWQLPDAFTHGSGMLLLFYSALGPGALAAVMQAKGQAVTSAAEAQVFYSLTPVMAAVLAALFLQGEEMGPLAWLGGVVIVTASIGTALAGHAGDTTSSSSSSRDVEASSSSSSGGGSSILSTIKRHHGLDRA